MRCYFAATLCLVFSSVGVCLRADDAVFPLMAWNSAPNDLAVLSRMRECGLTHAGFVPPAALDTCHAAGLKAIVSDERVSGYDWTNVDAETARKRVAELVSEVRDHPAVVGYYLRDEPTAGFFPGLAKVALAVRENDADAWPYINLFPNYANAGQLGTPDYATYLEKYIETCNPPILCYDHYALMEGGGLREGYFANLEAVRNAGVKHDLPFWNIVLTNACLDFRKPSAADLRFQVYTTLAYGGKGIGYFTYFTPAVGNFRDGPIDQFGHETPTWGDLRSVNLQVAKLGPTLLALKSDGVYHFGDVPEGATAPGDTSLVKAIDGPMLVGDFTHPDGSRYVLIVNKDVTKSFVCQPQFREAVYQAGTRLAVLRPTCSVHGRTNLACAGAGPSLEAVEINRASSRLKCQDGHERCDGRRIHCDRNHRCGD